MSEVKNIVKRFLSLILIFALVAAMLPAVSMPVNAATSGTVTGLADENIGLSFTGDADDAWSANGTSIIGAATSVGGTCSDKSYKSTLTITNKKSTTATLSFDYTIEQNSGKIQVDGTEVSSNASFTKELAANESVKVDIESGSTSAATKITLTNVVLVSNVNATATFVPAENGTYTVDGKLITEEYSNTQSSMTAYQVVATPAAGYQFMGWYDVSNEKYISTSAKAALNIENDCTITARFASKTAALFETGGQRFDDLGDAVSYAQANSQSKITLATDGSISGTYTIPAGITLLIPFDEAGTLYTDAPAAIRTTPASKAFRTLTMSEGTSITVNGAISLGGRYFAAGGGQQGRPVGDYGYIKMADNSSITVKNGGKLYAWGFISGSGSVLAESGATVYEFYQIADFRGGSASSGMGHGVFPFSQYFVQNIEVPLTLNAGANEQVYSGVYAMSTTYTTAINFIGDTGMFKVESGSFTKDYDEKTDRLVFTVNGEAALNTLSLTLAGMDVNSASYVLPITNNITINIQSGNVTINQDAALLAGVQVNIAEGAGLTVANGKNIYFYDSDEWSSDNFVWGPCKFKSVAYAPGKAYNRSNNDLVDAKMDVNGNVTAIGAIYTTKGGADICSSNGTGKYIQQGTPGTATATYQYNAGSSAVTIPITAAKLHNADGTYTETATASAGNIINYVNGVWGGEEPTELTVTFEANGSAEYPVEGTMAPQSVNAKTDTALNTNSFTREGYNFANWNTKADGSGTPYADKATVNLTENTTLYAQWRDNHSLTKVINKKDATCTEDGYTGDTVCAICGKEITKGETIQSKGHTEVIDARVEPTCTKSGKTEGKHCSVCNMVLVKQTEIPAKGHSWGEAKYTWAADGKSCTAEKECTVTDCNAKVTDVATVENGKITSKITTAATCKKPGTTAYTAKFDGEVFKEQTKDVEDIPATGHSWGEAKYTWAADGKSCTAEKECTVTDCNAKVTDVATVENGKITSKITTAATCKKPGTTAYTAKFDGEVFKEQTKDVEDIPATGHSWGEAKYTWAADGKSCTAEKECTVTDCNAKVTDVATVENGKITSKITTAATCKKPGTTAYTAKFDGEVFKEQTKDVEDIPATGHSWGEAKYTWAADGKSCTAEKECTVTDCNAKVTDVATVENGKITSKITTAATCKKPGTTAYTAKFDGEVFKEQTKDVEDIPATGHSWDAGWTVDKEPTCKDEGSKSHHCKNCDAKSDVTVIPTVDHNYQNGKCTYCGEVKHTSSSSTSRDYVTNVNTDDDKTTVANIIPRNNGKLNISDTVLKEIFSKAAANSSTKVVIRVHHKYTNSSSVYQINLSQDMIDNLIKDNKYELVINTGQGEFTLNAEILKAMSAKAADGISVTSRELDQSEMTKKQKAACGEYGSIIQLIATDSKGEIIWSGNGAHTALIPVPDKLADKDVKILVIDKYGLYRELESSVVEQNGKKYFSFSSDGTARYIITDSGNAVSLLDKQAQRLKKLEKGVKKTKLKLNVSVTSKGNMKLTWKKSKGYSIDYYQVYRAVKKKGFGKKAFYQNSSDIRKYINTKNLKQGKRYYYKVRGVRLVGDKLVYTGWSNIDSEIAD